MTIISTSGGFVLLQYQLQIEQLDIYSKLIPKANKFIQTSEAEKLQIQFKMNPQPFVMIVMVIE